MADDSAFVSKEKLSSLTTTKKTSTVEAAFDSDESDWSDEDIEFTSVVKPVSEENVEVPKKSPHFGSLEQDVVRQDVRVKLDEHSPASASVATNQLTERYAHDQPNNPSSSPYFVKEANSSRGSVYETNEDVTGKVKRQGHIDDDDDDDDWDEESYVVKKDTLTKPGPEINRAINSDKKSNSKVFQPPSGTIKPTSGGRSSKQNAVDWSETYSDGGGSEIEDIENDVDSFSEKENPAETEAEPSQRKQIEAVVSEIIQKPDSRNADDGGNDNQSKKSIHRSPATTSTRNTRMTPDYKSLSKSSSPEIPVDDGLTDELYASGDSRENIDSADEAYIPTDRKLSKTLPSSSSAAQLFKVAPSSPARPDTQFPSKSTFLAASNPCLVETTNPKKPSKSSSAKHFLTRLFSSDSEKTLKTVQDETTPKLKTRTSDPIPLSTLLLNTPPVPLQSSDSENITPRQTQYLASSSTPMIPTRYFPPVSTERQENVPHGSNNEALPGQKRKGFFGKMKKTLGISSKGRKMRASESMSAIANTSVVTKGPSNMMLLPSEMNIVGGDGEIIAVSVSGRTADDVIMDLLKEGTRYLERTTTNTPAFAHTGGGDELVVVSKQQDEQMIRMGKDHSKRIPSADKYVAGAPLAGSSKISKSENSLVDDVQLEPGNLNHKLLRGEENMSSYYCSKATQGNPNRQVIYNILDDFCCVLDKTFGENDRMKSNNGHLYAEIDQLRAALECCEASKRDLERQIQELQDEIRKLQLCLEEECQARANLEAIVCELKAQLDRQDEILAAELAQKAELLAAIKQLETDNWNLKNQITDFGAEREEFSLSCKGFEGTKNKCVELQIALAECCEKHDLMQREILALKNENNEIKLKLDNCVFEKNKAINDILQNEVFVLRQENNDLKKQLDTCHFEKNKLMNEMERMRQEFAVEKAELEAKVCELLNALSALEKSKAEVCKQTNSMLGAHHEEMDNLKAEADSYKARYEQEYKLREDLEQKLQRMCNSS